ncbi:MAG: DsbA family protein [Bryobacteraceae bacterium]|nr:DsbA family protein [Bryobacteraceae bacterium]
MHHRSCFALLLCAAGLLSAADAPLATVGGSPLYESDLGSGLQSRLLSLKNQEYQLKSEALENAINDKLAELEAKSRGLTREKLLQQEVDSKAGEVSEAEVRAFYESQSARIGRPFEDVKEDIWKGLQQLKMQSARGEYYKKLRARYPVTVNLRPPKTEVGVDPQRIRGDASAPVTIVEFSDFQCPFCQRVQATLREILDKYKGKVRLAYRDFPLEQIHPDARNAAETSRCAAEQGKFWEFHDALFTNTRKLSRNDLAAHATTVGLDTKKLDACVASGKYKQSVQQDIDAALESGVDGAPAFFINGVFLNGAQPFSAFEKIIEDELAGQKRAGL